MTEASPILTSATSNAPRSQNASIQRAWGAQAASIGPHTSAT